MHHDLRSEFEVFLVEDVILTLGNLRGSLSWLGTSQSADPAIFRAGLDRLDRQIGLLEDRARALKRQMVVAAATDAATGGTTRPCAAGHPQGGIAEDGGTGAPHEGRADVPTDAAAHEASVDLEVGPDPSYGSETDAGRSPPHASSFPAAEAQGDAIPEPTDVHPVLQPSTAPEPVSPALVDPVHPHSDDGDNLNIFGSDADLLPDSSWTFSPVPFRSRRSGR